MFIRPTSLSRRAGQPITALYLPLRPCQLFDSSWHFCLALFFVREPDGRSDVYSLGVILYELSTGELPFRGNKRMLLHQVLNDEPRPPRRLNDLIPRALETICLKGVVELWFRDEGVASITGFLQWSASDLTSGLAG